MNSRNLCNVLLRLTLLLAILYEAHALPALETTPEATAGNALEETDKLPETNLDASAVQDAGLVGASNATAVAGTNDVQDQAASGDNVASASSNEPVSIYASGLITPEAFQQYLNQYGGASGLAPMAAAYPAPLTGAPGLYPFPGPIVVQTGYEGFLVPANAAQVQDGAADVSTTVIAAPAPAATPSPGINPLMAFASRLLPSILMSTLFRVAAVIISAVGVILFGGAITNALCRLTPICEIPSKAVDYLRSGGAQDVGRMIAEEITPERVRRTTEFVRNAIHKYRQLQKLVESDETE
ncbi:hypothetical protein KR222_011013 [Zaprionus bogoriensis]|nr:hypothetical protein KR222_011013 [Zaprionus bogoriensis]